MWIAFNLTHIFTQNIPVFTFFVKCWYGTTIINNYHLTKHIHFSWEHICNRKQSMTLTNDNNSNNLLIMGVNHGKKEPLPCVTSFLQKLAHFHHKDSPNIDTWHTCIIYEHQMGGHHSHIDPLTADNFK